MLGRLQARPIDVYYLVASAIVCNMHATIGFGFRSAIAVLPFVLAVLTAVAALVAISRERRSAASVDAKAVAASRRKAWLALGISTIALLGMLAISAGGILFIPFFLMGGAVITVAAGALLRIDVRPRPVLAFALAPIVALALAYGGYWNFIVGPNDGALGALGYAPMMLPGIVLFGAALRVCPPRASPFVAVGWIAIAAFPSMVAASNAFARPPGEWERRQRAVAEVWGFDAGSYGQPDDTAERLAPGVAVRRTPDGMLLVKCNLGLTLEHGAMHFATMRVVDAKLVDAFEREQALELVSALPAGRIPSYADIPLVFRAPTLDAGRFELRVRYSIDGRRGPLLRARHEEGNGHVHFTVEPPEALNVEPAETTLTRDVVEKQLDAYFQLFRDGSDLEKLRPYFATAIERFITLDHPTADAVVASAKAFFVDKHDIAYRPGRLRLQPRPNARTLVTLPVEMSWNSPVPASWGPDWDEGHVPVRESISRRVEARVEIVLDDQARIVSYVETGVATPPLRVTDDCETICIEPRAAWSAPVRCETKVAPVAKIPAGTTVADLGETVPAGWMPKGAWDLRKVRWRDRTVWVLDHNPIAVENPNGGTSAGEVACLVPILPSPGSP